MARFYGGVQGNRGEITRCGSKDSGIVARAQGWEIGARIECFVGSDDRDYVQVWITGGFKGKRCLRFLGTLALSPAGDVVYFDKPTEGTAGALFGTWKIVNGQLVMEGP